MKWAYSILFWNSVRVTAQARDLAPKYIELLHEAVPGAILFAVLTNPLKPELSEYVNTMRAANPGGCSCKRWALEDRINMSRGSLR